MAKERHRSGVFDKDVASQALLPSLVRSIFSATDGPFSVSSFLRTMDMEED